MPLQRVVYILLPRSCQYYTSHDKVTCNVTKLRTVSGVISHEDSVLGHPGGPGVITGVLIREKCVRKGSVIVGSKV